MWNGNDKSEFSLLACALLILIGLPHLSIDRNSIKTIINNILELVFSIDSSIHIGITYIVIFYRFTV